MNRMGIQELYNYISDWKSTIDRNTENTDYSVKGYAAINVAYPFLAAGRRNYDA